MNISKYLGLNYASKGRAFSGVDCWGLVYLFYRQELGYEVPDYSTDYEDAKHRKSVSEVIKNNIANWQKVEAPEYGDMLLFNILGLPLHTAVYIGGNDFLHAFQNTNSCIERLDSITWSRRLVGAYRWVTN